MSFRLVIECSKDIDKLQIDFTDGTSVIKECELPDSPENPESPRKNMPHEFLNTDDEFPETDQEVIELPNIPNIPEKSVKVAEELQNLNI